MNKHEYKAGDKVRALVDFESLKKGEIYEVEEFLEGGCELWVDKEKTGYEYMFFYEIEPVTEPKYKAGDKVRALVDYESLKKGEIYEVREVLEDGCLLWRDREKTDYYFMEFQEIEPVTEPAIFADKNNMNYKTQTGMTGELLGPVLDQGHWVAMEYNNRGWKVFMYQRPDGKFQGTNFREKIEQCLISGVVGTIYTKKDIEDDFTGKYAIVTPAPKMLEEGDMVQILDIAKETKDYECWGDAQKEMVGGVFEIDDVASTYYCVWNKDKTCSWNFPHWAVAKAPETKHSKQDIENAKKLLQEAGVLQDGKVIV